MNREILIEMKPEQASEFVATLQEKGVELEGPDQVDSLDGVTLASVIVTVTPVVAPFIIELIQTLKGSKGKIRRGDMTLDLENFSGRQLKEILSVVGETE